MEDNGSRTEGLNNLADDGLENGVVGRVSDTVTEGDVDGVTLSALDTGILVVS